MAKKKGEAHHGGAWKVAYADFVTAMMALFMVLWICSQDKKILLATSRYFKQPFNAITDRSVGVMPGKDGGSVGKDQSADHSPAANLAFLNAVASELNKMLNVKDVTDEKVIELNVTSDGLKITLFERTKKSIFEKGSAKLTDWGRLVLQNLAWLIDRNGLKVYVEGHAAEGFVGDNPEYTAWELTTDRANAVRRMLEKYAVDPKKIERVTGYGASKPLKKVAAAADDNDRITISLSAYR